MWLQALMLLVLAAGIASPSAATRADELDQDKARQAVQRGEMRPLADILSEVRPRLPGEVVGVEIERRKGRWMYEFRVIGAEGRVYEVYVDAKSAAVERVKEK